MLAIAGCGGGAGSARPAAGPGVAEPSQPQAVFADEDDHPAYGPAELARALAGERALAAQQAQQIAAHDARTGDLPGGELDDQLRVARADLAVRTRFIATLEACDATHRLCPPRLDDPAWSYDPEDARPPPLTAPLRFDVASWQAIAAELDGRACACRTQRCVDSLGAVIDQLEARPMREVQGDDAATASLTAARGCLYKLRGEVAISPARPTTE